MIARVHIMNEFRVAMGKNYTNLNFIEYIPLFGKRTDLVILIIIIPGFRKKNVSLQKKKNSFFCVLNCLKRVLFVLI